MRTCLMLLSFCLLGALARAQHAYWQDAGTGDPSDLQLVFENCSPEGDVHPPAVSGVTFDYHGTSSQTSIVNFTMTRSVVVSYHLQTGQPGQITLPAFPVKTNKGEITVAAYTTGTVQPGPEADIHATMQPALSTVWAGQVFALTYTVDAPRSSLSQLASNIDWDSAPLTIEDWSKPQTSTYTANGTSRLSVAYQTRGICATPGDVTLKPASQQAAVTIGVAGFSLFPQAQVRQVTITSNQAQLSVRPLPAPAPADFMGAVGRFTLTSRVVPQSVRVGDPITWTLELSGTGNWPAIKALPAREASQSFQIIRSSPKAGMKPGRLFDGSLSQDVVLIPTAPGQYHLGQVSYSYFDPEQGSYQSITIPAETVTVLPAVTTPSSPPAPSVNSSAPAPSTSKAPAPPAAPAGLPGEPVPGSAPQTTPFTSTSVWLGLCIAPFGLLPLLWLLLAWARFHRDDPQAARRRARKLLLTLPAQLGGAATTGQRLELLRQWQRGVSAFWPLRAAAPTALALTDDDTWRQLWAEADHALYAPAHELPADWPSRARQAAAGRPTPRTQWRRLLAARNFFPWLSLLLVIAAAPFLISSARAASAPVSPAIRLYQQGDFKAAEQSWRLASQRSPADWIARNNLALALAQQEQWPLAAAEATAAFVQNPRAASTRWNLNLMCDKAGYTPTVLAPFIAGSPWHWLARLASPAEWERLVILGAALAALALAGLLLLGYGCCPRWLKWPCRILLPAGVLLAIIAAAGRTAYGIAADSRAALVWQETTLYSIPTEADTTQQTTTLPAGSTGVAGRTFLGWFQMRFPNGQTGWIRRANLVLLWQSNPEAGELAPAPRD